MSSKNDKIGALVCALPGMRPESIGLISDIAHRLNHQDPATARAWQRYITDTLKSGLPDHMTGVLQMHSVVRLHHERQHRLIAALEGSYCRDIDRVFLGKRFAEDVPSEHDDTIQICLMRKSVTAREAFEVFGIPLSALCLSQSQIVGFIEGYSRELARNGDATLALVRSKNPDEIVVVSIGLDPDSLLEVGMCSLSDTHRYDVRNGGGRHRLLVPHGAMLRQQ